MGLLSPSTSLTRYRVEGAVETPLKETVLDGLTKHAFSTIEDEVSDRTIGWASFKEPFHSSIEGYTFIYGGYFVFSLRIDKKSIPKNLIHKYVAKESARKLESSGREYLSRDEKKMIKEHVVNTLQLRMPATPNIYNILWNYERGVLFFFSNLKNPNEVLESLFYASFNLRLIRLLPYTLADLSSGLSDQERDFLQQLSPTKWST